MAEGGCGVRDVQWAVPMEIHPDLLPKNPHFSSSNEKIHIFPRFPTANGKSRFAAEKHGKMWIFLFEREKMWNFFCKGENVDFPL